MSFPLISWLSKHAKLSLDDTSTDVYLDCPKCGKRKKLGVALQEKILDSRVVKPGHFKCFSCYDGGKAVGWSGKGSLVGLVSLFEQCSYIEAKELIARLSGLPETVSVRPKAVYTGWQPKGLFPLTSLESDDKAIKYLENRGLAHLVPYCSYSLDKNFYDRIIIPIHMDGKKFGFAARAYKDKHKPKELYPKHFRTDTHIYYQQCQVKSDLLVITEGIMDAESYAGFQNAVGLFGKYKPLQLKSLLKTGARKFVLSLDGDAKTSTIKLARALMAHGEVWVVPFLAGEDPNSCLVADNLKYRFGQLTALRDESDLIGFEVGV